MLKAPVPRLTISLTVRRPCYPSNAVVTRGKALFCHPILNSFFSGKKEGNTENVSQSALREQGREKETANKTCERKGNCGQMQH